jgi:hypothetical protein
MRFERKTIAAVLVLVFVVAVVLFRRHGRNPS